MKNKFDKTLIKCAIAWSEQSYCKRNKVGAVIVKDGRILATGYNGTITGSKNKCEDIIYKCCIVSDKPGICSKCGKELKEEVITSEFTVHAEQNAISFAAKNGIKIDGCSIYITLSPCKTCSKLLIQSGIKEVIYLEEYRDTSGIDFLKRNGIKVRKITIV